MSIYFKKLVVVLCVSILCNLQAQPDSLYFKPEQKFDQPTWTRNNEAGLIINQIAFVNWNAGGVNSVSAIIFGKAKARFRYGNMFWNSTLTGRYGINSQQGQSLRKSEDILELISNFGYRDSELSNWFYSGRFSFATQFTNGFNYPDNSKPISKFMAPGYLFFGVGIEYGKNIEKLSLYLSPLTLKTTFVLDEALANAGSFGVDAAIYDMDGNIVRKGRNSRNELGILVTNAYETKLFDNVNITNLLSLYTDYINYFGNIDVDWEINFNFKVNDFVKASLGSHIRYDNDIKNLVAVAPTNEVIVVEGAKVQWKQLLGIGVNVDF